MPRAPFPIDTSDALSSASSTPMAAAVQVLAKAQYAVAGLLKAG